MCALQRIQRILCNRFDVAVVDMRHSKRFESYRLMCTSLSLLHWVVWGFLSKIHDTRNGIVWHLMNVYDAIALRYATSVCQCEVKKHSNITAQRIKTKNHFHAEYFSINFNQVEGTLSVQPQANPVVGFEEHFLSLTVENNVRNPWFVGECVCDKVHSFHSFCGVQLILVIC